MQTCLTIKNLSKKYSNFTLDKVNLSIPKGCIMGLIGENGAGKTTLMSLILNLVKKDEGEILIFGKDYQKFEKQVKEDIGIVLDESVFQDSLTSINVNQIMKSIYKNWEQNTFFSYLERFEVSPKKKIKEYSLGMKKKLALAVAMSHQAKLLLLDEAMSGLDPVIRNEILDVFMDFIQDEEHSILLSSHITGDLEKIADYITFIHKGKVVMSQNKDLILEQYGILKCGIEDFDKIDTKDKVSFRKSTFGYEILIENKKQCRKNYSDFIIDDVSLEDIMLFYVRRDKI